MKKLLPGLFVTAVLFTTSCKKEGEPLAENVWTVAGKSFKATTVKADPELALISASGGNSSLDLTFKTLPTASADFTVSEEPYTKTEVAVKTILSGSIVYNSIGGDGSYVSVGVINGKYTLLMGDIVAVNAANVLDTVRISANIVEQ